MDLFDNAADDLGTQRAPLAVRMRPRTLDEVVGQERLLIAGSPLRRLAEPADLERAVPSSIVLFGPPGTGKTTLAYVIAQEGDRDFVELSAVTAGVKEVRAVINEARHRTAMNGRETVLFIDEVHRFSKTQQDALLPAVENRWVTLIAATTENPSFSVIAPLLSRSLLVTLESLGDEDIGTLIDRALGDARGFDSTVSLTEGAREQIIRLAGGDARRALTILEAAAGSVLSADLSATQVTVDESAVENAIDHALVRYDRSGDQHYDVISAFIKSIRGSDVDAALHYLARMIAAGEDPRFIARRIIISAAEDVGMADPTALQIAVAAAQAVALIGMPEARIILAEAVVYLATAPKSNAAYLGIDKALADIESGKISAVPMHLRGTGYPGASKLGSGKGYIYSHDAPHGVAQQQYAPDALTDARYYHPTDRGYEREVGPRLKAVRSILHGEPAEEAEEEPPKSD